MNAVDFAILSAILVLYLLKAVQRVSKDERLIFFENGKPVRVAGPGKVLAFPGVQKFKKLDMRPRTLSLPYTQMVEGQFGYKIVDPLKAANLANVSKRTEEAVNQVLSSVIATATLKQCLTQGYTIETAVNDLANKELKGLGVKITSVAITKFPMHERIAAQLAGTIHYVFADFEALLTPVAQRQGSVLHLNLEVHATNHD